MRLALVIPAYNVAGPLKAVLADLRGLDEVREQRWVPVVVDDGSGDRTAQVAAAGGAELLTHPRNRGKGAALATGFAYAVEHGFEAVVTLDGDGQHEVASIADLVAAATREGIDIVVGNRMGAVAAMPWIRVMTNRVTSAFVSHLAGQRIEDSQSGFRLIRTEVLKRVTLTCEKYDAESELLIKAGRLGYRIGAAPIRSVYMRDGESHINPFVDTLRFVQLVVRSLRI